MNQDDSYKTIIKPSQGEIFKDKSSKFLGFVFPISEEAEVKLRIQELKKEHYSARHWCYAYQIGTETLIYRVNDDGEPNNSAGMPIYGQIQSFDITNVLVVVIRYYGGVKLGVGGLMNAYKTAAKLAIKESTIVEQTINCHFKISCTYKDMNKVMRIIKEKQLKIVHQKLELICEMEISVRKNDKSAIVKIFQAHHEILIEEL